MEFVMFDKVVKVAKKLQKNYIKGIYIPTKKNNFVKNLYESLGFTKVESQKNSLDEVHYTIKVKNLKPLNKLIEVTYE